MGKITVQISTPLKQHSIYISLDAPVITIGRAFDNDIILDDPFVSERHCRIVQREGEVVLENLDSTNGVYSRRLKKKIDKEVLESGDGIVVGRTSLRVYTTDHAVGPARPLSPSNRFLSFLARPLTAVLLTILLTGYILFEGYMATSSPEQVAPVYFGLSIALMLIAVWIGFWILLGRLITHKVVIAAHVAIAAFCNLLLVLLLFVSDYVTFYFNAAFLSHVVGMLIYVAVFSAGLYWHMGFATGLSRRGRAVAVSFLTVIVLTLSFLFMRMYKEMKYLQPQYFTSIHPPFLGAPPAVSSGEFISSYVK